MNAFGRNFGVEIFGESHGAAIGVVVDGVMPGIELGVEDFMPDILRRKSGAKGTTPRIEADEPEIERSLRWTHNRSTDRSHIQEQQHSVF